MTILQSLQSLSNYPIPASSIQNIAEGLGIDISEEATPEIRESKNFKIAKAQTYLFLSEAMNFSQGDISFSFTDDDRKYFRILAGNLLEETGYKKPGISYGYKGSRL